MNTEKLKALLANAKLKTVARVTGVTLYRLCKFVETGEIYAEDLGKLAQYFGLSVGWFYDEEGENTPLGADIKAVLERYYDEEEETPVEGERPIERLIRFMKRMTEARRVMGLMDFSKKCGIATSFIYTQQRQGGSVSSTTMAKIAENFPELNLAWLCTGKGRMITDIRLFNIYKKELKAVLESVDTIHEEGALAEYYKKIYLLLREENEAMKNALDTGDKTKLFAKDVKVLYDLAETLQAVMKERKIELPTTQRPLFGEKEKEG
ncbi:MAG: hypothetical protein LUC18_02160 [Porphyromonadaceae bacterium]|nr:hypothetical protein [Porphyromonadaceae bacterium]